MLRTDHIQARPNIKDTNHESDQRFFHFTYICRVCPNSLR
jgi:hypothetical protein